MLLMNSNVKIIPKVIFTGLIREREREREDRQNFFKKSELGIFLKRKRHKVNINSRDTFFKSQQISII